MTDDSAAPQVRVRSEGPPITNVVLSSPPGSVLGLGTRLCVTFDFHIEVDSNIWVQGGGCGTYGACPRYPQGSGSGKGWVAKEEPGVLRTLQFVSQYSALGGTDEFLYQISPPIQWRGVL